MCRMLLSTTSLGGLVTWNPTRFVPETRSPWGIVPIQSLEPDNVVLIQSLEPDNVVPIEELFAAPVVSVASLAPDMMLAVA